LVCGFGPKGTGKYSFSVGKDSFGGPDLRLKASLTGLSAGCEGASLTLVADFSWTTTDCVGGDCTATADGFPMALCVVAGGKCSINTNWETFLGLGDNFLKSGQTNSFEWSNVGILRGATRTFRGGTVVGP
jgi:hypothetical protein